MAKYFLYARKSSESEERQIMSIDAQIDELKEFAVKEKLEIVKSAPVGGRNSSPNPSFRPSYSVNSPRNFSYPRCK